ncbi:hypothetical protein MMPV_001277 [Pyropia vietnamensis]
MVETSPRALVALTREPPKNEPLDALLTARSIPTVHLPCVARLDGPDLPDLPTALTSPPQGESWAWVVVTSPEAASIVVDAYVAAGRPSPPPRLAVVGDATGQVLAAAGLPVSFVPSVATGAVLVAELPPPPPPSVPGTPASPAAAVLYPASMRAGSGVADGLAARGYAVIRLNTYTTAPAVWGPEQVAAAAQVGVVSFASPSAVKAWGERRGGGPVNGTVIAACIGETSAAAARAAGFSRVMAAAKPGLHAWADVVEEAVGIMRGETVAAPGRGGGH